MTNQLDICHYLPQQGLLIIRSNEVKSMKSFSDAINTNK